jgi:hypothetical protein
MKFRECDCYFAREFVVAFLELVLNKKGMTYSEKSDSARQQSDKTVRERTHRLATAMVKDSLYWRPIRTNQRDRLFTSAVSSSAASAFD